VLEKKSRTLEQDNLSDVNLSIRLYISCNSQLRTHIVTQYSLNVNGKNHVIDADGNTPLLYILRGELDIKSTKYGCGTELCGACRILVDGNLLFACTLLLKDADKTIITTVEGLTEGNKPGALQQAFLDINAGQCGYCLAGILITADKLLEENRSPDRREIQLALDGHLCRCGAHNRIIKAIQSVAESDDD